MITFVHYHQIEPELFREHVKYYMRNYNLTPLESLAYNYPLLRNPLFITFDDGWGTNYNLLPIYETIPNLVTIFLSKIIIDKNRENLSPKQIHDMNHVVNFQSHGMSHSDLTQLTIPEVKNELVESKKYIEKLTDKPVYAFAYPYNKTTPKITEEVKKAGYLIARLGDRMLNHLDADRYTLNSIGIPRNCTTTQLKNKLLKARIKTTLRRFNVY